MIDLDNEFLTLTLSFYSNSVIPRNIVQDIVDKIIQFTNTTYMSYLCEQMQLKFSNYDKKLFSDIQEILDRSKNTLNKFKTEYQRFSLYKQNDLLTTPVDMHISTRISKKLLDYEVPSVTEDVWLNTYRLNLN